jgi:hypothetical protein
VVEVKPWQTLEQISLGHFGRFDKKLLREIRALNPQMANFNDLAAGQRILLPSQTLASSRPDFDGREDVQPINSMRE